MFLIGLNDIVDLLKLICWINILCLKDVGLEGTSWSEKDCKTDFTLAVTCSIQFAIVASILSFGFYKKLIKNRSVIIVQQDNDLSIYKTKDEIEDQKMTMAASAHVPTWLDENKEIVFSPEHIQRKEMLGSGQYGVVYKGSFCQGKAM